MLNHVLVPKHSKASEKETAELLEKYKIRVEDLPRINIKDPAISHLDIAPSDVIKVERPSATAKVTVFYRRVVK
ncbi:MAG: DNA-directed RNA polymerase subunit RpoH/Rpb5 C-terminal domain-containing protein [archaeon]